MRKTRAWRAQSSSAPPGARTACARPEAVGSPSAGACRPTGGPRTREDAAIRIPLPRHLDEVLALLAEHGDEAKVLAGGQSLVPLLAMRLARPAQLVDVNRVAGLGRHPRSTATASRSARLTRERDAERSAARPRAAAAPGRGAAVHRPRRDPQPRHRRRQLAHADASAELPAVAVAIDGEMVVRSSRGERVLAGRRVLRRPLHHRASPTTSCSTEVRLPARAGRCRLRLPRGRPASRRLRPRRRRRHGRPRRRRHDQRGAASLCMGVADRAIRAARRRGGAARRAGRRRATPRPPRARGADLEPASDIHGSAAFRDTSPGVTVAPRADHGRRRAQEERMTTR